MLENLGRDTVLFLQGGGDFGACAAELGEADCAVVEGADWAGWEYGGVGCCDVGSGTAMVG
jgi:hypothetical protein